MCIKLLLSFKYTKLCRSCSAMHCLMRGGSVCQVVFCNVLFREREIDALVDGGLRSSCSRARLDGYPPNGEPAWQGTSWMDTSLKEKLTQPCRTL